MGGRARTVATVRTRLGTKRLLERRATTRTIRLNATVLRRLHLAPGLDSGSTSRPCLDVVRRTEQHVETRRRDLFPIVVNHKLEA